jgi:hypothetical protein
MKTVIDVMGFFIGSTGCQISVVLGGPSINHLLPLMSTDAADAPLAAL